MAKLVSKTVQRAIQRAYARLATAAVKKAVQQIDFGSLDTADKTMWFVAHWLEKAGAEATDRHFNV